jgi:glucoamylase
VTLGIAEQIYDALITWDLLAELEVTQLSLAFFHQFNQHVEVGRSQKCSRVYVHLTDALRNWAEKTLLFIMDHIPDNYVLPMAMDRITTKPTVADDSSLRQAIDVETKRNAGSSRQKIQT